ncbi:hypothetical protein N8I77_007030 [Diaporthe amygdali]|uniref:FAD-binding PCMH-type domain-containing protein n=1 Tax=Phomopsis amygdali TaxID=1214568 RepID=A0AAD9W167_PHOAM|nr:hypothetical protein N8I77_007030 [Diaporthe amygdali]
MPFNIKNLVAILAAAGTALSAATRRISSRPSYRFLPGDPEWPSDRDWATLNRTVGGNLIRGVPLAQPCYGVTANAAECSTIQNEWAQISPFVESPVNTIDLYWNNNSCNPFDSALAMNTDHDTSSCTLGNLAQYAIKVTDAESVIAGVKFARDRNIRLTVKNTGHDFLGRSMGKGSLGLWTHNLKDTSFFQYKSAAYTGPAARVGAGIEVAELYAAAAAQGYRAVAGSCPSVGAVGGFTQGGGHGPLSSAYGLGADQTLEFDVVTVKGDRLTASRTKNSDLYYALSGGGAGNYGVVLSMTVKVHKDGPVAGAQLMWTSDDDDVFAKGVKAWIQHLPVLDAIPGFRTDVRLQKGVFYLAMATLPDGTEDEMLQALLPYHEALKALEITPSLNETTLQNDFLDHYTHHSGTLDTTRNLTIGSQLVPRAFVEDTNNVDDLVSALEDILDVPNSLIVVLGTNVTHARVGNQAETNGVSTMWRDSLFLLNVGLLGNMLADWPELVQQLDVVNGWEQKLRTVVPGGGAYMNEGTYDNPYWREDYYGDKYDKLLKIKRLYDPNNVLWNKPAVGHDALVLDSNGRLHKA